MANSETAKGLQQQEIREQLDRIRYSTVFVSSDRISRFLEFVVEETLAGRADRIKQYTVAVEGLGDAEDFDPTTNPAIRILARRVRRALGDYYEEAGAEDPVRIGIPKGTYVPTFTRRPSGGAAVSLEKAASQTDEPRIAVLPFSHSGTHSSAEHFAKGLTAELTTGLTAFRGLEVIGWHTALRYGGEPSPAYRMSQDLGVRFVLSGTVGTSETAVKVSSQLVDTDTAAVIWAESFRRDLSAVGLFEIMDAITTRIVASIGDYQGVIPRHLKGETRDKRPDDLTAYEATLLFHDYLVNFTHETYLRTRRAIEIAVEIEPRYALGWTQLAELYCDAYNSWDDPEGWPENALECTNRALALDPLCQEAWTVSAYCHFLTREHETAIQDAEKGIRLNPRAPFQVAWAGWLIGLSGRLDRGLQLIEEMERLNPYQPGWMRAVAYLIHLERGEYDQCLSESRRIGMPGYPMDYLMRASAAGLAGNETIAIAAWRKLNEDLPDVAANPAESIGMFFHFDRWVEPMLEGLDKAARAAST